MRASPVADMITAPLALSEQGELRRMLNRAIMRLAAHPEILWRYGVMDDCYAILRELDAQQLIRAGHD